VLATPLLLVLIMGVVQFALWQHAEHVADAVAQQGLAVGASKARPQPPAKPKARASSTSSAPACSWLPHHRHRTATTTTVVVTGHAISVFGLFSLPVKAVASGPTEDYSDPAQAP